MTSEELDEKRCAFARAVIALAREHHVDSVGLTFRFGSNMWLDSGSETKVGWNAGRHGQSDKISIQSTQHNVIDE